MNNRDIENLSLEELYNLHHKIVRRINELNIIKLYDKLKDFQIGEQVDFINKGNTIIGTIVRINQKTLSVKTKEGSWYVDPRAVNRIFLASENK